MCAAEIRNNSSIASQAAAAPPSVEDAHAVDASQAAPEAAQAGLSPAEQTARLALRQMSGGFSSAALMAKLQAAGDDHDSATAAQAGQHGMGVDIPGQQHGMGVDVPAKTRPASEASLDDVRMGGGTFIKKGAQGEQVKALQEALNAAGIQPPLPTDGKFDAAMDAAIRKFQADKGCAVDGIVGPETMGALDQARGIQPNAAYADAHARLSGGGGGVSGGGGAGGPTGPSGAGGVTPPSGPAGSGSMSGIDKVIEQTAKFESSRKYDAWNPDDAGHGVSFGLVQFNQKSGGLPSLMQHMRQADPAKFDQIMGPHAANMTNTGWVRGANLNDPDIKSRMLQLARDPEFQTVQRDEARKGYFDPAQKMAEQNGLKSERAMSMLFDSCIQNGTGGTAKFLKQAAAGGGGEQAILARFADLADRGSAGRRHSLLRNPALSDAPFNPGVPTGPAPSAPSAQGGGGATAPSAAGGATGPSAAGGAGAAGGKLLDKPIGPGTKVLMIGDSHTAGAFGTEMDKLLRSTGASVETFASSGSSPSWWMNGQTTHSGFVARHADGKVESPTWNEPHATPKLADLIREQKPDVLVVNLGANMRGLSPEGIKQQVAQLAQVAKENGTKLVWTGPPDSKADAGNTASLDHFNQALAAAVAPYGGFVNGSQYTSEYSGGDGLHYNGDKGTKIAKEWAGGVFNEIQRRSAASAA